MSQKEFATFVVDSNILNMQEIVNMIKHYSKVLASPLPYLQSPRIGALRRFCRFKDFNGTGSWVYNNGEPDSLILSVDEDISLHGVQHFGCEGCVYTVSMEIKDKTTNLSLVKKSGTYCSEKDSDGMYYGFDVLIDVPVILESGKRYEIRSMISGPQSWFGAKGQTPINFEGLNFTFSRSESPNNCTSETGGQFAVFLFTHSG
ncbi:E3 ubiquitin-protein ligase MYCBP2-like [Acropora millepora]|uniref:E3 ubiquitin-protein ligase MYCBP2-like n=1 Tax=Acropora millepora TaxID=45264 RepID=UPI001CF27A48|nr:E3 ubiquitin-protein ligase MYCBP2-like [Acropora millepora]